MYQCEWFYSNKQIFFLLVSRFSDCHSVGLAQTHPRCAELMTEQMNRITNKVQKELPEKNEMKWNEYKWITFMCVLPFQIEREREIVQNKKKYKMNQS